MHQPLSEQPSPAKIDFRKGKFPTDLTVVWLLVTYGLLSLMFVLAPGDGTWMLYGKEILLGKTIYGDLNLNQQPIFPLLSAASVLLGRGYILAERILFVPILIAFIFLIYRICKLTISEEALRPVAIIALFFSAITFEAYRFDDYHALAGTLILASFYTSLSWIEKGGSPLKYALIQTILCALLALTRLNDGGAVAIATLCIWFSRQGFSVRSNMIVVLSLALGAVISAGIIFAIGETPTTWFAHSFQSAAVIKGGDRLLNYPAMMVLSAYDFLRVGQLNALKLVMVAFGGYLIWLSITTTSKASKYLKLIIGGAILGWFFLSIYQNHLTTTSIAISIVVIAIFWCREIIAFSLGISLSNSASTRNAKVLTIYPAMLFIGGALSSGGSFRDHFFPMTLTVITALYLVKLAGIRSQLKDLFNSLSLIFLIGLGSDAAISRINRPYGWHSYNVPMFFSNYDAHFTPDKGPHLIPKDLFTLIQPVCALSTPSGELLSLPFSFANYYCGIPPWNGYIQTFFDTSSEATINRLISELEKSPPSRIFYQRQTLNLKVHEDTFNGGNPLPHRRLDKLIMSKIERGDWVVMYKSYAYAPSEWILINTEGRRTILKSRK
jgi:hypothetical protein